MSRIDMIGLNGATGEHYLVEKVARLIAGDHADRVLRGKNKGKAQWELHIKQAMNIIDVIKEHKEML